MSGWTYEPDPRFHARRYGNHARAGCSGFECAYGPEVHCPIYQDRLNRVTRYALDSMTYGKSLVQELSERQAKLTEEFSEVLAEQVRLNETRPPTPAELIPKLPTLGGGWTPQQWLRWSSEQDRKKGANGRANEAESIADWIDSVVELVKPKDQEEEMRDRVDAHQVANDQEPEELLISADCFAPHMNLRPGQRVRFGTAWVRVTEPSPEESEEQAYNRFMREEREGHESKAPPADFSDAPARTHTRYQLQMFIHEDRMKQGEAALTVDRILDLLHEEAPSDQARVWITAIKAGLL